MRPRLRSQAKSQWGGNGAYDFPLPQRLLELSDGVLSASKGIDNFQDQLMQLLEKTHAAGQNDQLAKGTGAIEEMGLNPQTSRVAEKKADEFYESLVDEGFEVVKAHRHLS